jgi:protease-4
MALETDAIIERLRLRRRVNVWRVVAVVALLAAGALALSMTTSGIAAHTPHVARYTVEGIILEDRRAIEALAEVAGDENAKALIVYINSPGGSTYGGEALFLSLRKVAQTKPVVAVIGTLGASAGYMVAVAADRVLARESSLTGSIGVLVQSAEASKFMEKIGVTAESITSGPLKDEPSPFRPMSEKGRKVLQQMVDETHLWFVGMVAERRNLPVEKVMAMADGRILTGRVALQNGLIDEFGGEDEARTWLETQRQISKELPTRDVELLEGLEKLREALPGMIRKSFLLERLTLDGLASVWHPAF